MKAVNDNMGTPIAKGLNVLLTMAIVLMVIAILLFFVVGFVLTSDNAFSADIMTKLAEAKSDWEPYWPATLLYLKIYPGCEPYGLS